MSGTLDQLQSLPSAYKRWYLFAGCLLLRASGSAETTGRICLGTALTHEGTHHRENSWHSQAADESADKLPGTTLETLARHHGDVLSEWLEEYLVSMYVSASSSIAHQVAACACEYCAALELRTDKGLRRRDLSPPEDHLEGFVLYIRIRQPKTKFRPAHCQHVRIDEPGIASWVEMLLSMTPKWRRIGMALGLPSNTGSICPV